jgi:tRNA 2-thiouridine synthesizing protein A
MTMAKQYQLDVSGLLCPLPVLKARKRLLGLAPGDTLEVIATDPMSAVDMPHFCSAQGYRLLSQKQDHSRFIFTIER